MNKWVHKPVFKSLPQWLQVRGRNLQGTHAASIAAPLSCHFFIINKKQNIN